MLLLVIASMTGVCHRALGSSDSILEQIWENDITSCDDCTEIAQGWYHRNGVKKSFLLLHKSQNGEKSDTMFVYLSFLRGDKYLIQSRFLPEIEKIETGQAAILSDIDSDKPRTLAIPMYENLRETNINPLFLNIAMYLVRKYTMDKSSGGSVEVVLKRGVNSIILPHKIVVWVEEKDGYVAPTQVEMYRNGSVVSTIRIQNAIANGRLRPFAMVLTSQERTDEIKINSWGTIPDNHEYFTRTGLGRGDLSISNVSREVFCPPEICKK